MKKITKNADEEEWRYENSHEESNGEQENAMLIEEKVKRCLKKMKEVGVRVCLENEGVRGGIE